MSSHTSVNTQTVFILWSLGLEPHMIRLGWYTGFGVTEECSACIFHPELQPVHSSDTLMPTNYPAQFNMDCEMNLHCYETITESIYKLTFLKTNLRQYVLFIQLHTDTSNQNTF